jgi:hypothetical protein
MAWQTILSDQARRFLLNSVPSVPFLEAVLLLRAAPEVEWTCEQLARRLYVPDHACSELVAQIAAAGLIELREEPVRTFHYAPHSPELMQVVDEVARAYATHLIEVTNLIHSSSKRQAQRFADAFNLRKE